MSDIVKGTGDEQEGMNWWNGLTESDRRVWLTRSGGSSAADAWACYRSYAPQWTISADPESCQASALTSDGWSDCVLTFEHDGPCKWKLREGPVRVGGE